MSSLIGMQVPVISFVDEGFEETVDRLNGLGINALFVATQAFDRGVQGRQVNYRPWPATARRSWTTTTAARISPSIPSSTGTLLGP